MSFTSSSFTFNSYNRFGKNTDEYGNVKTYKVVYPGTQSTIVTDSFPEVLCGTIQKLNSPFWKTVEGKCNECTETYCDPTFNFEGTEYRTILCRSCYDTQNYDSEVINTLVEDNKLKIKIEHESPEYSHKRTRSEKIQNLTFYIYI